MKNSTKHILIAEGDRAIRESIDEILTLSGYKVTKVKNSVEAMEFLQCAHPDLILLDVSLLFADGFKTLEAIRGCESTNLIPVILQTFHADVEFKINAVRHGANDYIVKPFNSSDLCAMVMKILRRREMLQARFHTAAGGTFSSNQLIEINDYSNSWCL